MPKIKIFIKPGETKQQAEEDLFKALSFGRSGDSHAQDKFNDPAMQHTSELLQKRHELMIEEMMREIEEELDKEFNDGHL